MKERAIFDDMHMPVVTITDEGPESFSELRNLIENSGMRIEKLSMVNMENIGPNDILWISFIKEPYTADEINFVRNFVNEGGKLFVTAEWGNINKNVTLLNDILKPFNISFNPDRVTDYVHSIKKEIEILGDVVGEQTIPHFIILDRLNTKHEISKEIEKISFIAGCSVMGGTPLVFSSNESFGDLNANMKWDKGERIGSFPVICCSTYGKGKIVCIGDTSLIMDKYIDDYDNRDFIKNVFKWLSSS